MATIGLMGWDRMVAGAVSRHEPDWLQWVAEAISQVGGCGLYPLAAAVLLAWTWWSRTNHKLWRTCIWMLTAEGAAALVVRMLKICFGRWRPGHPLAGQFDFFAWSSKGHSFPSGHTADAAVVATVLWFAYPRLRPFCAAWVLLMAAARIGTGQHFVADVSVGAALGMLCALALHPRLDAIERWIGKDHAPAPEGRG